MWSQYGNTCIYGDITIIILTYSLLLVSMSNLTVSVVHYRVLILKSEAFISCLQQTFLERVYRRYW